MNGFSTASELQAKLFEWYNISIDEGLRIVDSLQKQWATKAPDLRSTVSVKLPLTADKPDIMASFDGTYYGLHR